MVEETIPHSWEGRRVTALIVGALYPEFEDESGVTRGNASLAAYPEEGTLEQVTVLGIVASFEKEDEPTISAFYPWNAVLRLHPAD